MRKLYWQWLAALCGLGIIAVVISPVITREHEPSYGISCQSNLKNIALGLKQYIQDNDEKYPPFASSGKTFGWIDACSDYIKSTAIFHCPTERNAQHQQNPRQSGYTDYWYNRNLAGVKEEKIHTSDSVILLGDGNDGTDKTDASYSLSTLPAKWVNDPKSPMYRHKDLGANYAFLDGHVKWYKATEILSPGSNTTMDVK